MDTPRVAAGYVSVHRRFCLVRGIHACVIAEAFMPDHKRRVSPQVMRSAARAHLRNWRAQGEQRVIQVPNISLSRQPCASSSS